MRAVGEMNLITPVLFFSRDSGVTRHLLGNKDEPRGRGKKQVLRSDVSSLATDSL